MMLNENNLKIMNFMIKFRKNPTPTLNQKATFTHKLCKFNDFDDFKDTKQKSN